MMQRPKLTLFAIATVSLLVVLSGCGAASSTSHTGSATTKTTKIQAPATLTVHSAPSLGQVLVDGSGRTLYLFEADTSAKSTCNGPCALAWPPLLTSSAPHAGSAVMPSLLGTTTRQDGTLQVTYNGHPLYYFAGDTTSGETKGQGLKAFGAEWYVVSPAGAKVEQPGS